MCLTEFFLNTLLPVEILILILMFQVFQRFANDCVIAAVSMATGLDYADVLETAKKNGFIPGDPRVGFYICDLLDLCGFDYTETVGAADRRYEGPAIFLIPSPDGSGDWHSVVIYRNRIFDPSFDWPARLGYTLKTASHVYDDIRRYEE